MGKDVIPELIKMLDGKLTHAALTNLDDSMLARVEELLHHWHEIVTSEIGVRQAQQFDDAKRGSGR